MGRKQALEIRRRRTALKCDWERLGCGERKHHRKRKGLARATTPRPNSEMQGQPQTLKASPAERGGGNGPRGPSTVLVSEPPGAEGLLPRLPPAESDTGRRGARHPRVWQGPLGRRSYGANRGTSVLADWQESVEERWQDEGRIEPGGEGKR